jgi:DNA invertase Pin-like site-specific DNA recombinase
MRAAIYLRVSTDGQTTENQRLVLEEVAKRRGWQLVTIFEDQGISGAKGRDKRPGFDRMLKDAARRRFDVVMVAAIDRLGRSTSTVSVALADLASAGVEIYSHREGMDGTTPYGRAMLNMASVFAELERDLIRDRVKAGLARTKAEGTRLGRPPLSERVRDQVRELRAGRVPVRQIAERVGIAKSSVQAILAEA